MKNKKGLFLVIGIFSLIILLFFALGILYFNKINSIKLYIDYDISKSVYKIDNSDNDIFSLDYQDLIDKKIMMMEKFNDYTFNNPLLIMNPYGTNLTGLYIYFETDNKRALEYTISVDDPSIPDYTNMLVGDLTNIHKGLIIGLVQGLENTITFRLLNEDLEQVAIRKVVLNLPIYDEEAIIKIDNVNEENTSEGLFFTSGMETSNKKDFTYISLYDNNGILRVEVYGNNKINGETIKFTSDSEMVYLSNNNGIIRVNKYGKLVNMSDNLNYSEELVMDCQKEATTDLIKCQKYTFQNIWFGTLKEYLNYGETIVEDTNNVKISNNKLYKYNAGSNTLLGLNLATSDFTYYNSIYFDVYKYDKNELIIPSKVDDVKIKKITGFHLSEVKIIKIEEGIEEIADYCFVGVNKLEKLYIPKTVKKIGKDIFGDRKVEIIYY